MERSPRAHAHLRKVITTLNSFGLETMGELSIPWFETKAVTHMQSSEPHKTASPSVSSLYLESSPTLNRFKAKFRFDQRLWALVYCYLIGSSSVIPYLDFHTN